MKAMWDATGSHWSSGALQCKPFTLFTSTASQNGTSAVRQTKEFAVPWLYPGEEARAQPQRHTHTHRHNISHTRTY
eukprot:1153467-Pelagomonas_calceolata.AAC.6